MKWRDLPDDVKNILEWLESPNTNALLTLTLERGKPAPYSGIPVSDQVLEIIKTYAAANRSDFMRYEVSEDVVTLKLL